MVDTELRTRWGVGFLCVSEVAPLVSLGKAYGSRGISRDRGNEAACGEHAGERTTTGPLCAGTPILENMTSKKVVLKPLLLLGLRPNMA